MASYQPPKRATEYIFYIGLEAAAGGSFQTNATLASGDVKISKDGGALANLTTLPVVTPAGGKLIKVTVSSTEMDADNVALVFSDASGAEWKDLIIGIAPSARQIDDLAFPTTSGRSTDVTATGAVGIDWGNVENPTTTVALTGTTAGLIDNAITAAKIATNAIDADALATDAVQEIADMILKRGAANVDGASPETHSLYELIEAAFESAVAGTTWTIKRTDGSTTFNTRTVTTDASAEPIIAVT